MVGWLEGGQDRAWLWKTGSLGWPACTHPVHGKTKLPLMSNG
jgi:hypothetical protein